MSEGVEHTHGPDEKPVLVATLCPECMQELPADHPLLNEEMAPKEDAGLVTGTGGEPPAGKMLSCIWQNAIKRYVELDGWDVHVGDDGTRTRYRIPSCVGLLIEKDHHARAFAKQHGLPILGVDVSDGTDSTAVAWREGDRVVQHIVFGNPDAGGIPAATKEQLMERISRNNDAARRTVGEAARRATAAMEGFSAALGGVREEDLTPPSMRGVGEYCQWAEGRANQRLIMRAMSGCSIQ